MKRYCEYIPQWYVFRSCYSTTNLLYGVYDGTAQEIGGYWTTEKPSGPVQLIVDSALNPQWGNTATKVVKIEVPAGTKYYEGIAAPQG